MAREDRKSTFYSESMMPNDFSIEIHKYLSQKILEAEKVIGLGDQDTSAYAKGQLEELQWIRKYLQENIDLKNFDYF